jgi:hypothetical protein
MYFLKVQEQQTIPTQQAGPVQTWWQDSQVQPTEEIEGGATANKTQDPTKRESFQ